MKRRLLSVLTAVLVAVFAFTGALAGAAQAQPLSAMPLMQFGGMSIELSAQQQDLLKQLEDEVLPKLESILTPEQREEFTTEVSDGISLRKAFKSITLTPAQKSQLAALFKTLPKKDIFASMTPAQKKEMFMKQKELFKPTPEEITDKIRAGMKKGEEFRPEGVSDKINAATKDKGSFMPDLEAIGDKITERMKAVKGE